MTCFEVCVNNVTKTGDHLVAREIDPNIITLMKAAEKP